MTTATLRSYKLNGGPSTPWGKADLAYDIVRGVKFYITPGHGGFGIAPGWAEKNLSPQARYLAAYEYGKLWYEEDCQCELVFYEHPEFLLALYQKPEQREGFSADGTRKTAEDSIRRYYPSYFDSTFVEECEKAGSIPRIRDLIRGDVLYLERHPSAYVVTGMRKKKLLVTQLKTETTYAVSNARLLSALKEVTRGTVFWRRPSPKKLD